MALTGSRVDTWLIHLTVETTFMGVWDTFSGGEVDSEEAKYRPGGFDQEISLGGRRTFGNVTLSRYWDDWVNAYVAWLQRQCGKGRVYINRIPYTANWVQLGRPIGYSGTLKRCSTPDVDSMGTDAALIELEATIDNVN